ncbi:MAG: hypothetical protein O9296_12380 [Novosphingobium sp.]|nr:hypothetical protein [Novosphingobium sp.]
MSDEMMILLSSLRRANDGGYFANVTADDIKKCAHFLSVTLPSNSDGHVAAILSELSASNRRLTRLLGAGDIDVIAQYRSSSISPFERFVIDRYLESINSLPEQH